MYSVYIGIEIVAILLTFIAIVLIMQMDGSNTQKMMVCFMIGVLIQNASNLFEVLSTEPAGAIVAIKLQYLGACFVPLFFSQFIYLYCHQYQPKWLFRGVAIVDLIVLAFVWTCDHNHLFYKDMKFITNGDHPHFVFTYGFGFWLFIWLGVLLPYGAAAWALIRSFMEDYYQKRRKMYIIIILLSIIPAATLLLRAGQRMKDYDLVPLVLALMLASVVIFVWSRRNYDLSRAAAETVLHELKDGVIFLDEEQRIVGYNPITEEIFPDVDKRIIGKTVTKIRNFPEEILSDQGSQEFQMDDRHFEGHLEPVNDKDGTLLGYIILIFNITQRKRLMVESIEMREKAEAANKAKSEFMAAMSHEMRTPMNAIVGFAELIKEESLGRKVYQYACDIKNASGRLLEIFNDIWDISSVEAGKMELEPKDYSTKKFLQEISDKVTAAAEKKGLLFEQIASDSLPAGLHGDVTRLRQVLDNVLDNAIKFTKEGRISMVIDGDYITNDQIMLKILIRDTGIGIEEKNLQKIFNNFEQVDSSGTRSVEGTGLGLSVAKNIVELMNGRISAESTLGQGSTFTILIPQKVTDQRRYLEVPEEVVESKEEIIMFFAPDCHVLIVDDNLINRKIVRGMLKNYGFQIEEAESGYEAIDFVKEQKYDIIFMDHMMPDMDGVETTQILREDCGENGKYPVVIALTANILEDIREMFLSNGFQDFVAKPIDRMPLHKVLSKWVPDDKKQEAIEPAVADNVDMDEIAELFINGINVKKALEQHTGNLNEYLEILNLYHIDGSRKIEYLQTLIEKEDYTNYRIEVHALKGASANIGAQELADLAALLEKAAIDSDTEYIANNHDAFIEAYKTLLGEIKAVLDKQKKKETQEQENIPKESLADADITNHIKEALAALEHFKSKECKEKVEWLLDHELTDSLRQTLVDVQNKLQLYEDDDAEELLRSLI